MNKLAVTIFIVLAIIFTSSADHFETLNYEIVSIKWPSLYKRSTRSIVPISLTVFNKLIDLNLRPADDIIINPRTPVYNIERVNAQLKAKTVKLFDNMKMKIYEDEKNFASVVVNIYPNGVKTIENAIIGAYNLILHPATKSTLLKLGKNITGSHMNDLYVVYKHQQAVGRFLNPLERNTIDKTFARPPLNLPDVIYPEILVIVDYYLAQNLAEKSIVPYVLTFWNQVNLMYRSLNNPKYRINIAGIVIPKNLKAVDYISSIRAQHQSKQLNFEKVISQCFKWLYNHRKIFPINSYDIAMTMTSTESESTSNLIGLLRGQEIGLAMVSGACQVDHYTKNVLKAGMILDNGDFSGVATAAHELGHTLGAYHDSGRSCPESKGYLMSPALSHTIHRFEWSKCSLHYFRNFLNTNPQCLFNKPSW